jgi:APA family basic amino acid/polyamine antiporter
LPGHRPPDMTAPRLLAKKSLRAVIQEATDPNRDEEPGGLKRTLGAFHLTMLGIGGIIGAGIFSLTGAAAHGYAGPGIALSFVLGGVLCALAGVCYAELAAMIPVAGSAYTYAYTTMGELFAWIIGWDLVLEYAFGSVVVSIAWSGYLLQLFHSLGIQLPDALLYWTKGPYEAIELANGQKAFGNFNLPAALVSLGCGVVLYRGIRESAWVNNVIVAVKVTIVCLFIVLGIGLVSGENLWANPAATGLSRLVPAVQPLAPEQWSFLDGVFQSWFGYAPTRFGWGWGGVLTGAGVVFFAYIGFDAVSTMAAETKQPQRDLPIGILGSLAICTILYILVSVTLTGVVHYSELGVPAPIAVGIDRIAELRHFGAGGRAAFTASVKLGALAGLTSVILVLMLGQTRIFYAMSKDGLLPWFRQTHPRFHSPHIATVVTAAFVALAGGFLPMALVGELVSIGTLLAFVIVCLAVPVLRRTDPDVPRPFKVKAPWLVGILGAAACLFVMIGLPPDTWLRLFVWLAVGFGVYFGYGRHHSLLSKRA